MDLPQKSEKPFAIAGNVRGAGDAAGGDTFVKDLQIFSGKSILLKTVGEFRCSRSSRHLRLVSLSLQAAAAMAATLALLGLGTVWTEYDYKVLDLFYRKIVQLGQGPRQSPQVVFVTITDRTYDFAQEYPGSHGPGPRQRRPVPSRVEAVAYDVIFARPSRPQADERFAESIRKLGVFTYPSASTTQPQPGPFRWEEGQAYGGSFDSSASPSRRGWPGLTLPPGL